MLGWSPPGTWRTFDFARVANLFRISSGMTLSASPRTYHEGIVFQPIAEAREVGKLDAATDYAASAVADRHGSGEVAAKIQAHVIAALT
jgi:hypothetical protein